jgi:hypothetical protein
MYHRITLVFRARHGWQGLWRRRKLTWTIPNDRALETLESVLARYAHQIHRLECRPVEEA